MSKVELKKLPGGVKRKIAGLDFFVTRTAGAGRIAFSRDSPGQCVPLHLRQGEELNVREHQFLAATDNLDYSFERIKGVHNMLLGGSGIFIDKFERAKATRSCGCTATATSSWSSSTPASRSTSRPAAGCSRTRP